MIEDENNLDRAVFDVCQILAHQDHKMSKYQRDLGFVHFVDPFFLAATGSSITTVCLSVCPSVTPFSPTSVHPISTKSPGNIGF